MIPVTENLATEINKNKCYINNCSGIEVSECDNTRICMNPGNDSCTILEETLIPKPHSNPHISSYSDMVQARWKAMAMTPQSDDKGQSSHQDSGQQEESSSQYMNLEAEIHDC